jgi:predicted benzoate:H+ symporter BenE
VHLLVAVIVVCLLIARLVANPVAVVIAIVLLVGVAVLACTLQAIYRAALYIFAAEGVVADEFDTDDMHDVWRVK